MEIETKDIDAIVRQEGGARQAVIPVLQAIQEKYNYLPEEALRRVCEISEITPAQIVGVASFYSQFRFTPAGQHMVKVCVGTACHVKGAGLVYDAMKRELGLGEKEDTTSSGTYTIEKVNCLGCCTLAPVVQIDELTYGHVSTSKVASVLTDFESQKDSSGKKKFRYAEEPECKAETCGLCGHVSPGPPGRDCSGQRRTHALFQGEGIRCGPDRTGALSA